MTNRRTKIVATLGPASRSEEGIHALLDAGVDVFRLNFSHGSHESHGEEIDRVRACAARIGRPVAILADLQGPKIRTGKLTGGGPVTLEPGKEIAITTRELVGDASRVSTTYQGLPGDVKPADRILLDDGLLELEVLASEGDTVRTRVRYGGPLGEHKGINLPGVAVSAPSLTEKDQADLAFALSREVDYIALSFVRRQEDVARLKQRIQEAGRTTPVVAKIEKPEAVEQLDGILEMADAVMVARGDLGVETSPEEVPILQKRIIHRARKLGRAVITATQMLDSMIRNPRPTRAEASDVANAIFDGTDAVMLSGETASGAYPLEAVRTMAAIAAKAEAVRYAGGEGTDHAVHVRSHPEALVHSACFAARELEAAAIVAFTHSGTTARLVSQKRPGSAIYAFTTKEETYRRLGLVWGVRSFLLRERYYLDDLFAKGEERLLAENLVKVGDTVIMLAGVSGESGATNLMKIHKITGTGGTRIVRR